MNKGELFIEVWKDTRFFDFSMDGIEVKEGVESSLPTINIPKRTWNTVIFYDSEADEKEKLGFMK